MKVIDIWNKKPNPTISFELFPARSQEAAEKLEKEIDELIAVKPDFLSVTFGAGGSTRKGSRELIDKLKNEKGQEVVAYFACYGLGPDDLNDVFRSYIDIGIENILAVRGDPPSGQDGFKPHPDSLNHASEFITFIQEAGYDFCLGAAGYPEGHVEAANIDKDLEYLKLKVDNGAEYIIANYFYDNQYYIKFLERCRAAGIETPIAPGIMPIYSIKMMENLAKLCGATITDELRKGLAALPDGDKEALLNFGIDFATKQCRDLINAGVPGLHIYTMDRSKSSVEIVNRLRNEGLL